MAGEDGSASNAIDGQTADAWLTAAGVAVPGFPHRLIINLGTNTRIGGFRYTPRAGSNAPGRIKDYRVFVGDNLVETGAP